MSRTVAAPSSFPGRKAICWHQAGLSRKHRANASSTAFSTHPDALLRRKEAEARQAERLRDRTAQGGSGRKKWWEGEAPQNVLTIKQPGAMGRIIDDSVATGRLVVVYFFAPNCYGCKALYPKFKQIASKNPDVIFIKANTLEPEMLEHCEATGVCKLPYFHLYSCSELVSEFSANLYKVSRLREEIARWKDHSVAGSQNLLYPRLSYHHLRPSDA